MRWRELAEEPCSVARTLSVIGDRWTILILRECFFKVRRFEAYEQRLGIPRRVLSDRLKTLVEQGVLTRVPYQDRPLRYEYRLTDKGRDLRPVLLAMLAWGDKHMAPDGPPIRFRHLPCGETFTLTAICPTCGEVATPDSLVAEPAVP